MTREPTTPSDTVRLLHYWWPFMMGWSLTIVVHRATGRPIEPDGLALLLFGIIAVYSLDRVLDQPAGGSSWMRRLLAVTGAAASCVCAWLLFRVPVQVAALAPLMALASLSYPSLKRLPLLKTVLVSVIWTWSVVVFPFEDPSWFGWTWVLTPVSLPLLLLMASACLLCDLSDERADRASRVLSAPVLFGRHAAVSAAVTLAAVGVVSAVGLHRPALAIGGLGLLAIGCFPSLLSQDSMGPLAVDVILTLPGVLIATHLV